MNHHIEPVLSEELPSAIAAEKKKNSLVAAAAGVLVVIGAIVVINIPNTQTQGVGTYRNYSADAIIAGGAITEKELLQKYDQNAGGIQSIFSNYGIARSDLTGQTSQIKHGIVYQDGRVVVDGKTVATGAFSIARKPFYDSRGNGPKKVTINGTTYYEGPNMSVFVRPVDAYVFFRDGQFHRAVISSCANPVMGTPTEKPKNPVYSCDSLKESKIDRTRFRFNAAASASNGAQVVSYNYDFGDGTKKTDTSIVEHTYSKPGTYTVTVTVNVNVNGKIVTVPGSNCTTTVTVEEPPKTPVYTCDNLTAVAIQGSDRTYAFTLRYTAESGASLSKVTYDFGDGNSETFNRDSATSVEHQYANPGDYTTTATLYFNVTGQGEKSLSCKVTITVPKEDNCPLPGKEHLPKNSPECVEPPVETPPELPQTGLGEWLGAGVGLAALAAALYYWNVSQKNLKEKMLKK